MPLLQLPKRQLLARKFCKNGIYVFAQLTLLPTSSSYALQCFSVGQTPPKVPVPVGASVFAYKCTTCCLDPPNSAFQTASRSVQLFLHSSPQRVSILYNVH